MFTVRSLKIDTIIMEDPVALFLADAERPKKFAKNVCFYRAVGMDLEDNQYVQRIRDIDRELSEKPETPYLRVGGFKIFSPRDNIDQYTQMYDDWVQMRDNDPEALFSCRFPVSFQEETLEWTLKQAYSAAMDVYQGGTPQATPSMVRNFGVKLLYWIDVYLSPLYTESAKKMQAYPKILFVGEIKKQESLFLYFLANLGCDVLYLNPEGDFRDSYKEVTGLAKVHTLGEKRRCALPFPPMETAPGGQRGTGESPAEPACPGAGQAPPRGPVAHPVPRPVPVRTERIAAAGTGAPAIPANSGAGAAVIQAERDLSYEELAAFSSSVVMIKVYNEKGECYKSGSGVVINQEGYILTNFHVVSGGRRFSVQFENEMEDYFTDCLVKYHTDYDLAVIRVDKHSRHISILQQGTLVRGQKIVAIGSPLGLFNSVSDGIISGFRQIEYRAMVQFTAPVSHGSSGGALLDMQGRLIGVITAGFDNGQNLNLAVDNATIMMFVRNFLK